ncbi:hypothetical protein JTB14_003850 [Gonioctena quinquepunctata]|nr:hypothetical protein JTB14_003850 [Gonioctena quinquepunctata]
MGSDAILLRFIPENQRSFQKIPNELNRQLSYFFVCFFVVDPTGWTLTQAQVKFLPAHIEGQMCADSGKAPKLIVEIVMHKEGKCICSERPEMGYLGMILLRSFSFLLLKVVVYICWCTLSQILI